MFRKKYLWAITYGCLLVVFTVYVLLDTFVITRVYSNEITEQQSEYAETDRENQKEKKVTDKHTKTDTLDEENEHSATTSDEEKENASVTDMTYQDDNISITINTYRERDTDIYVADIQLSSAEYLKTALAQGTYGKNVTEKTSEIAQRNQAILAINGDYYGVQENGYVLRNGVIYRDTASTNREDLVIAIDGSFSIIDEEDVSVDELFASGAQQILSFGPALLMDGSISVTEDEEVGKAMTSNPRTAIGIVDDLHYVFVVSDGRTRESEGLTLYQLAEFMQSIGAEHAYNLDGGGSSTMYFNGEIVNKPTTNGRSIKERSVSDIVYIGY